jgi:hypothetical protein
MLGDGCELSSLQTLCTDRVENTVSNGNFIVTCVFIAAGMCLQIRCLETGRITSLFIGLLAVHATILWSFLKTTDEGMKKAVYGCLRN